MTKTNEKTAGAKQEMIEPKLPCSHCTKQAWTAMVAMQKDKHDSAKTGACYCRTQNVLVTYTWERGRSPVITMLQGLAEAEAIASFNAVVAGHRGMVDYVVPAKRHVH